MTHFMSWESTDAESCACTALERTQFQVSDSPYQLAEEGCVFGECQDNEFAVQHCCVLRMRWSTGVVRAMPPRHWHTPLQPVEQASK